MLQVARLAPTLLQSSADLVGGFFRERYDPAGGFTNRAGLPDLYYTVFGLEGLAALRAPIDADRTRAYLTGFGDGAALDFVHLSCLARCWANLPEGVPPADVRQRMLDRIATFRAGDGGFATDPDGDEGSAYGAFVALGAYQDLREPVPDSDALMAQLLTLVAADGGLNNFPGAPVGLTTATAAAAAALRQFGKPVPDDVRPVAAVAGAPAGRLPRPARVAHPRPAVDGHGDPRAGRAARRHLAGEGAVPRFHRFAVDEPGRLLRPLGRRHPRLRVHVLWTACARPSEPVTQPSRLFDGAPSAGELRP